MKYLQIKGSVLNSVPVKAVGAGALGLLEEVYTNRRATLTFAAKPNAGDTIRVVNTTYTYVATNTGRADTILIAGTKEDTALNTLEVLNTVENADVNRFSWTIGTLNTVITATELTVAPEALNNNVISSSSNGAGRLTQAYSAAATTIVNTESYAANGYGLLGQVGNLTLASQTTSGRGNATLFRMYVDAVGYRTAPAAITTSANDLISKFTFTVGTDLYNGYMYNPLGNTAQAGIDDVMYCIKATDDTSTPGSGVASTYAGKVFTVNHAVAQATDTTANNSAFMALWNTDAAKISFKQNNHIEIDNGLPDITVDGLVCGGVSGMTLMLQTADFVGLVIKKVIIKPSGITIEIEQNGKIKYFSGDSSLPNQYLKGTYMTLTEDATLDTLTIGIDPRHNLELDTEEKRKAVENSFIKAFGAESTEDEALEKNRVNSNKMDDEEDEELTKEALESLSKIIKKQGELDPNVNLSNSILSKVVDKKTADKGLKEILIKWETKINSQDENNIFQELATAADTLAFALGEPNHFGVTLTNLNGNNSFDSDFSDQANA